MSELPVIAFVFGLAVGLVVARAVSAWRLGRRRRRRRRLDRCRNGFMHPPLPVPHQRSRPYVSRHVRYPIRRRR